MTAVDRMGLGLAMGGQVSLLQSFRATIGRTGGCIAMGL
jgi:hypothetical protein